MAMDTPSISIDKREMAMDTPSISIDKRVVTMDTLSMALASGSEAIDGVKIPFDTKKMLSPRRIHALGTPERVLPCSGLGIYRRAGYRHGLALSLAELAGTADDFW
jgi:hypothetical protein